MHTIKNQLKKNKNKKSTKKNKNKKSTKKNKNKNQISELIHLFLIFLKSEHLFIYKFRIIFAIAESFINVNCFFAHHIKIHIAIFFLFFL